jgi:hypothetical protein
MKRIAVAASLLVLLTLTINLQTTNAQTTSAQTVNAENDKSATADSSAVQATVRNYIEAYYTGDARRMQQTLHPHYLKHKIHGDIPMREMNARDMVSGVNSGPSLPESQRTDEVTVLDVAADMASAKLVTPGWTDYITLLKSDGNWKILSVVQNIHD